MPENVRKSLLALLVVILFTACPAFAQQVEFSSSVNPVGSGARAVGMGGAFIGVADDATAASWNPAGLIQLEKPEVSLVYANLSREQTYSSESHPEIDGTNTMSSNGINYMSAVFKPFVLLDHTVVVSINYQRLYDMNKNVSIRYNVGPNPYDISFEQEGYLYAVSPAVAVQVSPGFSVGATINLWKDYLGSNGWDQTTTFASQALSYHAVERKTVSFEGVNMHLGFLWNATPSFTLGGVIKTPFDADLKETTMLVSTNAFENESAQSNEKMSMPLSYGLGAQYRASDSLILALDVYRTRWSKFVIKDPEGNEINPMTGQPIDQGKLKDTTQLRLGAEYLFIGNNSTIALRGGVFSDPEPATEKVDRYVGLSLGAGYSTKEYSLDAAYQLRKGNNVSGDISGIPDNETDITQKTFMASIIYYF